MFAERWNGVQWSFQPILAPVFSQPELDFLGGVSCASGSRCLAVGFDRPPVAANVDYDYSALAEAWDGTAWSEQSPPVVQTSDGFLVSVSCLSASDCIAVGQGVTSVLAMAWDGIGWTVELAPGLSSAMSILNGVSCTSAASCTAVGFIQPGPAAPTRPLVDRWNGARWSHVVTPGTPPGQSAMLNAVSCTRRSCTAVGVVGFRQLIERWDGRIWSIERPARAPGAVLNGVSCVSAADCVAVGGLTNGSHQALAERWNGTRWSTERTPTPASGSLLWAVSCPAAADCVAVGQRGDSPLIEQSHGTRWSIQRTT
jgi:hypothetical protein